MTTSTATATADHGMSTVKAVAFTIITQAALWLPIIHFAHR